MSAHPIEALLRPPVELWSTLVAFATAGIAILAPWALMMPPGVAYGAGAVLGLIGLIRGRQAWRVLRYQRNMRRLPIYKVRSRKIPLSRRKLFLGRGFRWTQKHTQRLRDTIRPEVQRYVQPGTLYQWARRKEVAWESVPILSLLARLFRVRAWWNPAVAVAGRRWQTGPTRCRAGRAGRVDGHRRAGGAYPGVGDHSRR